MQVPRHDGLDVPVTVQDHGLAILGREATSLVHRHHATDDRRMVLGDDRRPIGRPHQLIVEPAELIVGEITVVAPGDRRVERDHADRADVVHEVERVVCPACGQDRREALAEFSPVVMISRDRQQRDAGERAEQIEQPVVLR